AFVTNKRLIAGGLGHDQRASAAQMRAGGKLDRAGTAGLRPGRADHQHPGRIRQAPRPRPTRGHDRSRAPFTTATAAAKKRATLDRTGEWILGPWPGAERNGIEMAGKGERRLARLATKTGHQLRPLRTE